MERLRHLVLENSDLSSIIYTLVQNVSCNSEDRILNPFEFSKLMRESYCLSLTKQNTIPPFAKSGTGTAISATALSAFCTRTHDVILLTPPEGLKTFLDETTQMTITYCDLQLVPYAGSVSTKNVLIVTINKRNQKIETNESKTVS